MTNNNNIGFKIGACILGLILWIVFGFLGGLLILGGLVGMLFLFIYFVDMAEDRRKARERRNWQLQPVRQRVPDTFPAEWTSQR